MGCCHTIRPNDEIMLLLQKRMKEFEKTQLKQMEQGKIYHTASNDLEVDEMNRFNILFEVKEV